MTLKNIIQSGLLLVKRNSRRFDKFFKNQQADKTKQVSINEMQKNYEHKTKINSNTTKNVIESDSKINIDHLTSKLDFNMPKGYKYAYAIKLNHNKTKMVIVIKKLDYFTKDAKPNNSSIIRFVNPSGKSIDPHKYTTKPEDPSMLRFVNPSGKSFDPNIYHTRNRQFRINKKLLKKALSALTSPQGISYIIKAVKVAGFATISIDGTGLTDGQNGPIGNVAEGAANKNELEDLNCEDGQNETLNQTANKTGQYVGGFVASSVGKTMGSFLIPGVGPLVGALSLGWIGVKYGPKFASKGASYINSFRIKRKFKRNNDRKRTIQSEGQKSNQKQNPRGGTHPPTFE